MIRFEHVDFGYRKGQVVFRDLNLELTTSGSGGCVCGLLGKNGVGKSSLLKLISGLRFANAGSVNVLGFNALKRKPAMLSQLYFMPEEVALPDLDVQNYERVYAPFYPNFSHEDFVKYLTLFELEYGRRKLKYMSFGQKKKVEIAFSAATNTPLLLLDEPTNGLDIPSKGIFRKIVALATHDRLLLISTHQVLDLQSVIDTIIILDNGNILLNATEPEIARRLAFVADNGSYNGHILFTDDSPKGRFIVTENTQHIDSNVDIEMLFNAVILNKETIKRIFNQD